ncbi:hypothetical protein DH2020_015196 [Rehmannia glutinosa]|uniref:Uncharacterized protein n=1 Tax=Rehmannia glutinosa TaxID=99300 RepID=A0ABR0WSZ7_REHGL
MENNFLEDLKDHIVNSFMPSMDEHKPALKTIKKMFGMSKVVAERSLETNEVESSLPLEQRWRIKVSEISLVSTF